MSPEEYRSYDGVGLARLVNEGEVTRRELVEIALGLVEDLNPRLNAICHLDPDRAVEQAAVRDQNGGTTGPFDGVPFLTKELGAERQGWPSRLGSRAAAARIAGETTELTRRFDASGLVAIGATTTPEFGLIPVAESALFGDTANPWDLTRTPGASSGGSAAAVAAGIVPLAHANDGGGSIRIPASCCGLVGLKVSRGRNPQSPAGQLAGGLGVEHVVSRTVRDTATALDAVHGIDVGAPYVAPEAPGSFLDTVSRDPAPLRIAVSDTRWDSGQPLDQECQKAIAQAVSLLESLGHRVEWARPECDYGQLLRRGFGPLWAASAASAVNFCQREFPGEGQTVEERFEGFTLGMAAIGSKLSAAALYDAQELLARTGRVFGRFHQTHDLQLSTVLGSPPIRTGDWDRSGVRPGQPGSPADRFLHNTPLANATGQPAISLPLYQSTDGLPIGISLMAPYGREDLLLAIAGQLERACPWADRRPPLVTSAGS